MSKRLLRYLALVLAMCSLAVLVVACGSNENELAKINEVVPLFNLPEGGERDLEVVLSSPKGPLTGTQVAQTITVVFNQPMVPLCTEGVPLPIPPITISPAVRGQWSWKGTATLVFTPETGFSDSTDYAVKIPAGVKSYSGRELLKDYSFSFTTPVIQVAFSYPEKGSKGLTPSSVFYIGFTQPIVPSVAATHIKFCCGEREAPFDVRHVTDQDFEGKIVPENLDNSLTDKAGKQLPYPKERMLALLPREPLQRGQKYKIVLTAGLIGTGSAVHGLADAVELNFAVPGPFCLTASPSNLVDDPLKLVSPDNLNLKFSNDVDEEQIRKHLHFTPAVDESDFNVMCFDENVNLECTLAPATDYVGTIDAAMKDKYGNSIVGPREFKFRTGDLKPWLSVTKGVGVVESRFGAKVPVSTTNFDKVPVKLARLDAAGVIDVLESNSALYDGPRFEKSEKYVPPGGFTFVTDWQRHATRNKLCEEPLPLNSVLGASKTGVVYANIGGPDETFYALYQVTDLGVSAKFSADNTLVWVTGLADAKPRAGAKVEIRDRKANVLWQGKTGSNGLAEAPGWGTFQGRNSSKCAPTLYVFASVGSDSAFISNQGTSSVGGWNLNVPVAWCAEARQFTASAFTERGVYRPGEKILLKGTVRESCGNAWVVPRHDHKPGADGSAVGLGREVAVSLTPDSGDNKCIFKGKARLNEYGSFDLALPIPANARPDTYDIMVAWDGSDSALWRGGIEVAAYVPAQFETTVVSNAKSITVGDKIKGTIRGRYLFGAPMSEAVYTYNAFIMPSGFTSQDLPNYVFGRYTDYTNSDETGTDSFSGVLTEGKGQLDKLGMADVSLEFKKEHVSEPSILTLESSVVGGNRQTISGRCDVVVLPATYAPGVLLKSFFVQAGQSMPVLVAVADGEGKAVDGVPCEVSLIRRDYTSVRKVGASGSYEWETESRDTVVATQDVRSSSEGTSVELVPPKAGIYLVRVTYTDSHKRQGVCEDIFYAGGRDYVSWGRGDSDVIDLVPNSKCYESGDTARVLVKSPYQHSRALVTVERDSVITKSVLELNSSAAEIEIPIRAEYAPNVFVSVLLISPRVKDKGFSRDGLDLGKPSFKIGCVSLPVDSASKQLQVQVKTNKQEYRPGETVDVAMKLRDASGNPVRGEVCLAVVDEGVLSLKATKTPTFFNDFYGGRDLSVETSELRSGVIGLRAQGTKGDNAGGGGGGAALDGLVGDFRSNFAVVALWSPRLHTDADGNCTASLSLPDNLTRFRLMAVAQTVDSCFGSGEASVRVAKPLVLLPSWPRFVRVGDQFQAGVVLQNNTDESQTIKVSAQSNGLNIVNKVLTVNLAKGASREVVFEFRAKTAGEYEIGFVATGGLLKDSLKGKLPVIIEPATETVATSGSLAKPGSVNEALKLDSNALAGTVKLGATVSSTLVGGIEGALDYLLASDYEYSLICASRLLMLVNGERFLLANSSSGMSKSDLRAEANRLIVELLTYQNSNGSFRRWKDFNSEDTVLTTFILSVLQEAKEHGYSVDKADIERSCRWLTATIAQHVEAKEVDLTTRAYVMSVVARCGHKVEKVDFSNLYHAFKKDGMGLDGTICLIDTARSLSLDDQAASLRNSLEARLHVEARTACFTQSPERSSFSDLIFDSEEFSNAFAIRTLLRDGEFAMAPKVVQWLMDSRDSGHWGCSVVDAEVVAALNDYCDKYESTGSKLSVNVRVGGQSFIDAKLNDKQRLATGKLPIGGGDSVKVSITSKGAGRLYYDLLMRYAPSESMSARDRGFCLFSTYSGTDNNKALAGPFTAGQEYKYTLTVLTPVDRRHVVATAPIPAGFEVVQSSFATEREEYARILSLANVDAGFGGFEYAGIEDRRVILYSKALSAGEHTYTFILRAMHAGHYRTPGARVCEEEHNEVYGTTRSSIVEILPAK